MSSMKIMIHHRRIVCYCSSLKSHAKTPCTPPLHQFDTSLWILARIRWVFVAPTFNPELQSGPCKNQAAMVSSSYNNLLDMATSAVDKALAPAVLRRRLRHVVTTVRLIDDSLASPSTPSLASRPRHPTGRPGRLGVAQDPQLCAPGSRRGRASMRAPAPDVDELQRKLLLSAWTSFNASSGGMEREGGSSEERLRETRSREG
jgi:hypothetical protein